MATTKQKIAIKKLSENIRNGSGKSLGAIMLESGYSESSAKTPVILTASKAFEEAKENVDYAKHLKELDFMASFENNEDKDNVLKSKDMLFRLGNKYPTQQTKILGLFQTLDALEE